MELTSALFMELVIKFGLPTGLAIACLIFIFWQHLMDKKRSIEREDKIYQDSKEREEKSSQEAREREERLMQHITKTTETQEKIVSTLDRMEYRINRVEDVLQNITR